MSGFAVPALFGKEMQKLYRSVLKWFHVNEYIGYLRNFANDPILYLVGNAVAFSYRYRLVDGHVQIDMKVNPRFSYSAFLGAKNTFYHSGYFSYSHDHLVINLF